MSKFKVIEKSRFLQQEEMANVQGGDWNCNLPYSTCGNQGPTYETCGTWNLEMYHVGPCLGSNFYTCTTYTNCNPTNGITTCGGTISPTYHVIV